MSQSLRSCLGDEEVFDLVCDYLRARSFHHAERALIEEREHASSRGYSSNQTSGSRLESLLERSYVTSLVSGNNQEKDVQKDVQRRTDLDGNDSLTDFIGEASSHKELDINTRLVCFEACKDDPYGASSMPIYQTSTFAQKSATDFGIYDYTRSGNPTRAALERQMAELENGHRAFAFTSGMAAISSVTRLAKAGEEIILCDDSYGGTYRLLSKVVSQNNNNVKFIDMTGKDGPENLRRVIRDITKLVMIESPTNPMQRVLDIRGLAEVTHSVGALLCIDNTMMSPVLQNPIDLGADIVIHSGTKFICGHSDTMAGIVVAKEPELCKEIYFNQNAEGTGLAPFDCWLLLRGIKTMGIRVAQAQENAMKIALFLREHPMITKVYYTGCATGEAKEIHESQARGGGSVICFTTGSLALSQHIVSVTQLFKITVSFGSVNSLISLPGAMSHASIPEEIRKARSFPEDLIRLSIGIENATDLINDLSSALQTYTRE